MKRIIYFVIAIVLISIGINCNKPDPKGNISGTVENEVTKVAIDNAAVVLQLDGTAKGNATTDSKGEFVFNEIEPAAYTLKVTANGYTENSANVSVKDGQTAPVSILLLPTSGGIDGVVKDSETGNPIASVAIKLKLGSNVIHNFTTGTDGKYSFSEIEPETYTVEASKEGEYEPNTKSVIVNSGEIAQGDINLTFIETGKPTLTTQTPTNITSGEASIIGNITGTGNAEITAYGHCWSLTPAPDITNTIVNYGSINTMGEFTSTLSSLDAETKYYIRAYATNSHGTGYSAEVSFTTLSDINVPDLTTNTISDITDVSAICGGNITTNGGATITERGVCWSINEEPTITDSRTSDGVGTGSFTSNIIGLVASTKYYVRAYATNGNGKTAYTKITTGNNNQLLKNERKAVLLKPKTKSVTLAAGTGYGNSVEFTTIASIDVPTVTTNVITAITDNSAISGGNISADGGATVTARGVCWSEYENPTITDEHTTNGTGTGNFTSSITGLSPGKIYYVRAYATNSNSKTSYTKSAKAVGTGYGNQRDLTTQTVLPTLTTTEASSITDNSAISGGNITNDGGASITARGVCYSTSPNPTITGTHTTDGTGTGSFSSAISGLAHSTIYYVRAYATNSTGTAYGEEKSFTSLTNLPILTTTEVSSIANNTATSGGNITFEGAATVTARGVCWSTTENPTITDSHTENGSGIGSYYSYLTELTNSTNYYVRAYATNSEGTAYGENLNFTTQNILPTVTTTRVYSISYNTATIFGNVTSEGGATVTVRGVCWSTTENPTISNSYTTESGGEGGFSTNITDLIQGTTYYVKAYATNNAGTAYGSEMSFTTFLDITGEIGTLADVDGNSYTWVGIGRQAWMAENLNTTHYPNDIQIPLVTDNTAWGNLSDNNTSDAYCVATSGYGALYTWAAAMNKTSGSITNPSGIQGVCPDGWHLPSEDEWEELENFIKNDGNSEVATALKSTSGWIYNLNGSDIYGFNANPGGSRSYADGTFFDDGSEVHFWSSDENTNTLFAKHMWFYSGSAVIIFSNTYKSAGYSVRCVKD